MIATTFIGSPAWLVTFGPDWHFPLTLRVRVATQSARSLTGREVRQPLGSSLRCRMQWGSTLDLREVAQFRNARAGRAAEIVLCPAWPFAVPGSDWAAASVKGGLTIGWMDGWATWAIDPISPASWDWVAPLLHGHVDVELPTLARPDIAEVSWLFEEDGTAAYALAPSAVSWTAGPALNDSTVPPVFPLILDWIDTVRGNDSVVEVLRRRVGEYPRRKSTVFYPQIPASQAEGSISTRSRSEVGLLLRWWQDRQANVGAHYVPGIVEAAALAASAAAGATAITLEDASLIGSHRYLALSDDDGDQVVRIGNPAGNVVPLNAPLSRAVGPSTFVSLAMLARHDRDELELRFESDRYAQCRVGWREIPEEYVISDTGAAPAESRGSTIGALPVRAWLYRITVDRVGTQTVYLRTSYERDLVVSGETWSSVPMSHNEIRKSVTLDRDELVLEGRTEPWLDDFLPGRLAARLLIEVLQCDVSGAAGSNAALRWSGEVGRVGFSGPQFRATCVGRYALFDRPVPRLLIQAGCNHSVYDALCGRLRSDWTFGAEVNANATSHQVSLRTWSRTGGLPTGWGFAGYFALGYIERTLSGVTDRWAILDSAAESGGLVTLTLDRIATWTAGQAVSVVPGCDGRPETCRAYHATQNPTGKFDNYARFGGFPFTPQENPGFKPPSYTDSQYGKK